MSARSHEDIVQRAIYWVATGLIALTFPLSVIRSAEHPQAYRPGVALAGLLLFGGLLAGAVWQGRRGGNSRLALRCVAVCSFALVAAHPWLIGSQPAAYPPLLHVLGVGAFITPAVFSIRWSTGLIPLYAVAVGAIRLPHVETARVIGESTLLCLGGLITAATVNVLQQAGRGVVQAVASKAQLERDALRAASRARERERWDGLIHDTVLGALRIAGRTRDPLVPPAAAELASQALSAVRGEATRPQEEPVVVWRRHAHLLGLDLHVQVESTPCDPEVAQALTGAVNEALSNIARHSGQCTATVVGTISPETVRVVVVDPGRGFDTEHVGAGITTSIYKRMEAVGGNAALSSTPSEGTRVTLAWQSPQPTSTATATQWRLDTVAPLMVLGALVVVMNVALGWQQWAHGTSLVVSFTGITAVVCLTLACAILHPESPAWPGVLIAAVGTAAVLASNTPLGAPPDWRYWYLGALTPAIGEMSFRHHPRVAMLAATLMAGAVAVIDARAGRPGWSCTTGPVPIMLATGLAGRLFRAGLDNAWQRVEDTTAQEEELHRAIAVEEERVREAARRVALLTATVGSTIEELVTDPLLTEDRRRALTRLEAATRDQLAAPTLLTPTVAHAVSAARDRGVRVDIGFARRPTEADRESEPWTDAHVAAALAGMVTAAPAASRVRVGWRTSVADQATLTYAGREPHRVAAAVSAALARQDPRPRAHLTADEDSLLVEFSPVRLTGRQEVDASSLIVAEG